MDQDYRPDQARQEPPQASPHEIVHRQSISQETQSNQAHSPESRVWRRWATVERLQTLFNGALVVVTTVYTFVSCEQWQVTKASLLLTQRAVEIADRQAKAAQDANELTRESDKTSTETAQQTLIANQRDWLGPNDAKLDEAPVVGKKLGFVITHHNTGREPARNVVSMVDRFITTQEEETNRVLDTKIKMFMSRCRNLQEREGGQVVYPSTGFARATLSSTFPEEMIDEDVVNGKKWLIIQGCFVYRTFDKVRRSAFCFFYKGGLTKPEHLNVCISGNYAD